MTDDTNGREGSKASITEPTGRSRRQFLKAGVATGVGAFALGGATLASGAKTEEICDGQDDYAEIDVSDNVSLIDNQWGDENNRQCIWLNEDGSFGWDFEGMDSDGINYPQLYIGTRPWGKTTETPEFPTQRGNVDELVMEVDTNINISGEEWNLAEEWWLLNGEPNADNPGMQYEVMLVLDANQGHRDAWGEPQETNVATDDYGNTIDFWAENDGGTEAPQIIYGVQGGIRQGKIDLTAVMEDMNTRYGPSNDLTFTGVELGTEYKGSTSGSITFNKFGLTVNGSTYTAGSGGSTTTTEETTTEETTTEQTGDNSATVRVDPASQSVLPDDTTTADLFVDETPDTGFSGYKITVSIDDTSVLTVADPQRGNAVTFPDVFSEISSVDRAADGSAVTIKGSDSSETIGPNEVDLLLATVDLVTQGTGTANLSLDIEMLDNENGNDILTSTVASSIKVEESGPTWPENPTDPDGDGLYEDVNGNNEIDFDDVNLFFQNSDSSNVTDNTQYYDFTGDGQIDFQDVMTLFRML